MVAGNRGTRGERRFPVCSTTLPRRLARLAAAKIDAQSHQMYMLSQTGRLWWPERIFFPQNRLFKRGPPPAKECRHGKHEIGKKSSPSG
jgi:hypothetical protein